MKPIIPIFVVFTTLICCKQTPGDKKSTFQIDSKPGSIVTLIDKKADTSGKYIHDKSKIPQKLISYIALIDKNLRPATLDDYDSSVIKNLKDKSGKKELPYFCTGQFNDDTIPDYALVLIKDSTEQLVYAFQSKNDAFIPYLIDKKNLISSEGKFSIAIDYTIRTETKKALVGIDTVYRIEFDAIEISETEESLSYLSTWDKSKGKFIALLFD
jgi:hypothetical protein